MIEQSSYISTSSINEFHLFNEKIKLINDKLEELKTNKPSDEVAVEEFTKFLNDHNIAINDFKNLTDSDNSTIAQRFCKLRNSYHLKILLLTLKKNWSNDDLNQHLLHKNKYKTNIFENSVDFSDLTVFETLKEYISNNKTIQDYLVNGNKDGKNIFHEIAEKNKIMALLFFYKFYFNNTSVLNLRDNTLDTPLHIACTKGNYDFVKYLVNLGADFEIKGPNKKTPLFIAVEGNFPKIVKYLIINGANKNALDESKCKPIDYAKDIKIIDILEDKNIFSAVFGCKTQYKSLKKYHRNIFMIILVIFLIIVHTYLIFRYKDVQDIFSDFNYQIELAILIVDIIFECLIIVFYIHFQLKKMTRRKKLQTFRANHLNEFCVGDNGVEFHRLFKYNENICVICQRAKELNTTHCITCDICVDGFDHHCFFVNTCITTGNRICFKFFLYESILTVISNLITSIIFIIDIFKYDKIHYRIFYEEISIDDNRVLDIIIYIILALYIVLTLVLIIATIVPFILDSMKKKRLKRESETSENPLLPFDGDKV